MAIVQGATASLIAALVYDGLKFGGRLLLGRYWSDFRKAHKKAVKILKKEFEEVDLLWLFGNYDNIDFKLEFDKSRRNNVVENFKRGLQGINKEVFIDEIAEELYEHNKEYPRGLLEQVVTRYVQEIEIELRGNPELLAYFEAYNTEQILQIVKRQSEHLGDFLDNVSLESIPEIPPQFVLPKEPYDEMAEALKKSNVLLIKGGAGIGKTILSACLAHQLLKKSKPVFWYQITGAVDSFVPVLNRIAYFLSLHGQTELFDFFLKERTDDVEKMNRLIKTLESGEYFIFFDDIFKVEDKKLTNFLDTLCRRLYEEGDTKVFYLSRHLPGFIDEGCVESIGVPGLSKPETKSLLDKFDIQLEEKHSGFLAEETKGNPKYLEFFKAWHSKERPKEEITKYIENMPADDEELQKYLLNNVYNDVLTPDCKALLQSLAIFRIPERKDFIEEVYDLKNGKNFNDVLDHLTRRLLLVDFYKDTKTYYAHDILIGFLQDRIDNKKETHLKAGKLYQKRASQGGVVRDRLESSYHFQQGEDYASSASMIVGISHDCMVKGWFWGEILDILDRFTHQNLRDRDLYASVLYNKGNLLCMTGQWNRADLTLKEYLTYETDPERNHIALNSLGVIHQDKGEWNKAIELYNKSLKIKEKIGDKHGMSQTFNNLGTVYKDKGEWDKAIEFYEKSLKIKEKIGDEHGMASTFNNLGLVYKAKGEWDKAIEFYDRTIEIYQKLGDEHGMASTFNNLGVVYQDKGQWDKTIEFYEKSLEIKEKIGDEHGMAQTKANIGILYKQQGKKKEARRLLEESLKTFEKIGDRPNAEIARKHLSAMGRSRSSGENL